jgi:hypothetical protein
MAMMLTSTLTKRMAPFTAGGVVATEAVGSVGVGMPVSTKVVPVEANSVVVSVRVPVLVGGAAGVSELPIPSVVAGGVSVMGVGVVATTEGLVGVAGVAIGVDSMEVVATVVSGTEVLGVSTEVEAGGPAVGGT